MIGVGTFKISERATRYVNEVLTSERLSYGPFTQKFERVFAAAHDSRYAVMTASGTCALLIALAALRNRYGWQDGDEVLVPAVTFIATSNVVLQLNLKPVFVDVDPVYYEMDPEKIEAAITPRTRCMIPVHLFGHPCEMDKIMEIAKKHKLRVVEDSCETMFTKYQGKSVGSFGDIGCFSTYVAHILTTGVGGLCTTSDADLAVQLRSLMNHGRDSIYLSIDDDKDKTKDELQMIIKRRFSFVQMGYSFRVTEMEGALGLAEFENHEEMMKKRRDNGQYFMDGLAHLKDQIQLPSLRPGAGHAFMMFPIVMKKEKKDDLVNYLEQNGIETRDMLPLINQPFYRELFGLKDEDFPIATWINNSGFYIASHQDLTEDERDYIIGTFNDYFLRHHAEREKSCLVLLSRGDGQVARDLFDSLPIAMFDQRIFIEASDDQETPAFYRERGFEVIQEPLKKGESVRRAIEASNCENIIMLGPDGSNDVRDIARLLIKLKQGNELVIASRFMPGGGRHTRRASFHSLGNRLFTFLLSVVFGQNITDSNNIFRGIKKSAYARLSLSNKGESAMFEMTVSALENHLKFVETPTVERLGPMDAEHARFKRNRVLTGLAFAGIMVSRLLRRSPSKKSKAKPYVVQS